MEMHLNLCAGLSCKYVILAEPAEKLSGVGEEKIIESLTVSDGIIHSTVDDVMEVSHAVRDHIAIRVLSRNIFWEEKFSNL